MKLSEFTIADSEDLQKLVTIFKTIYNHKGAAVKTDLLVATLRQNGLKISPQKFRLYLGHIRKELLTGNGYIVSNVHLGYWYTEDKAEMKAFLDQELTRMSNQYGNVQPLHQMIMHKGKTGNSAQMNFFS
jgi:hypothetical protein